MNTPRYPLKNARDEQCTIELVDDLAKMLHHLNVDDVLSLCAQFNRDHGDSERCPDPQSVYANLSCALVAALYLLGVPKGRLMYEAMTELIQGASAKNVVKAYAVSKFKD